MSGSESHPFKKCKLSSPDKESKSCNRGVDRKYIELQRSNCPIKASCNNRKTERQSKKGNDKEENCRSESLCPISKLIGPSSTSDYQPSTSIGKPNRSPYNTMVYSDTDDITNTKLVHDEDTEFPPSLSRDVSFRSRSVTSSSSRPRSPISSNSLSRSSNKSSCSFERSVSSGDVSPISIRDRSLSTSPNLFQSQNDNYDYLSSQYVENEDLDINDENNEDSETLKEDPALRQFDVLDELEISDQEEGEIMEPNSVESDFELESDDELPIDDIDEMLEEGLPENLKSSQKKECVVKLRRKVVLEEIGHDHFDLLPEGWIQIMHSSGMPVYLNQKSRVCTMSRPYYLGPGSSRNHNIPLSAIPCLHYRRASELKKKNEEEREQKKQSQKHQSLSEIELMSAEIETFEDNKANQSLEASELNEYCKKVFKFKSLTLVPFRSWADRRKYTKMRKEIQGKQRPTLPGGTKLLKFPIKNPDGTTSKSKGEWIINPNGKSYVCILHEYVQHALKRHPKYQFKELENPATPYSATVFIEDMKYGFGVGASKKHAKVEAAKAALEVLIPGVSDKIEPDSHFGMSSSTAKISDDTNISIFDQIKVEDPRVAEFCAKSTEPPPYAILLTCLGRNTGVGEIELGYEMSSKSFKQDEFTMTVGNHKATVACRNKREGKQRAAQAILKALHPNITYWGSLLRMYGNRSIKDIKEKKQEEQEITQLQSKAELNQPNFAILDKLKTELLKLKDKREAVKAKGTFILPENIVLPSLSSTDLNKVNLTN